MKKHDAMIAISDLLRGSRSGLPRLIGRSAVALALGFCLSSVASADMVFRQLPGDGNDAFSSISAAQTADDFLLAANAAVSGLVWWGSYSEDPGTLPPDEFFVRVSAGDGTGRPAVDPMAEFTQTLTPTLTSLADSLGFAVYRYEMTLPKALPLPGGTAFFLSIVNQFDINDPRANWYWLLSDDVGANYFRAGSKDTWATDMTGNFSFAINAGAPTSAPLPGTLSLLLSGLTALTLVGTGWRH